MLRATEGAIVLMYSSIRLLDLESVSRSVRSSSMVHCEKMMISISSGRSEKRTRSTVRLFDVLLRRFSENIVGGREREQGCYK